MDLVRQVGTERFSPLLKACYLAIPKVMCNVARIISSIFVCLCEIIQASSIVLLLKTTPAHISEASVGGNHRLEATELAFNESPPLMSSLP